MERDHLPDCSDPAFASRHTGQLPAYWRGQYRGKGPGVDCCGPDCDPRRSGGQIHRRLPPCLEKDRGGIRSGEPALLGKADQRLCRPELSAVPCDGVQCRRRGSLPPSVVYPDKLVLQILLVASLALHVITNIRPLMFSPGVRGGRKWLVDALFVLAVLLLFMAAAFVVCYLRWNVW